MASHLSIENTALLNWNVQTQPGKHTTQFRALYPFTRVQMFKAEFLSFIFNGEGQIASHESTENTVLLNWIVHTQHSSTPLNDTMNN